jgi:MFS family permease
VVITEIGTGVGILLMLVLPDVAAYLVLPLLGIALNGTSSVLYATIGDVIDPDRLPRAFGLFYTINSVCGLIVPLVFGYIGDAFGVVWQWTRSAYSPYPGYVAPPGAIGEYNGKFMVSQMVLRGSSHATPEGHSRLTYRNFFYPPARWQFTGLRLAEPCA